jgi:hypothetical protein
VDSLLASADGELQLPTRDATARTASVAAIERLIIVVPPTGANFLKMRQHLFCERHRQPARW